MSRTVNQNKPRFVKKKNRRVKPVEDKQGAGALSAIKKFISTLLSLAAFIGTVVGVGYGWQSLNQSPRVQVSEVIVEGINRVSQSEVDAYLGGVYGQSIFELNLDNLAFELRRHPWVADVSVRRKLPDSLMVTIVEHEPSIFVSFNDVFVADQTGHLFKRLSSRDGLFFPVLTGLELGATELGSEKVKATVQEAIQIVKAMEKHKAVFGRVEEIHFDVDLGWSIVTRPSNKNEGILRTHLGSSALRRIIVARDILTQLNKMSHEPEIIWVDGVKNPDRVHVRLRAARSTQDANRLVASAR